MSATFTKPKKKLTWLITGSSSGFGLSLVRIAQAGGHTVIATSRNPSRTPELVAEVEARGGKWLQLDVDSSSSAQVIEEVEKSGHEIDVLVNNAGYSIFAPVETFAEDEIRAQMETMYFGPLRLIQAVLPHFRKRRFGVIVNMSSGAALEGRDSMGAYAGAKAGLDGTFCIRRYPIVYQPRLTFIYRADEGPRKRGGSVQHPSLDRRVGHLQHQHGQRRWAGKEPSSGRL